MNFAFDAGYMIYRNQQTYEAGTPALQIISGKKAYGTKAEKLKVGLGNTLTDVYYDYDILMSLNYYPGEVIYRDFEAGDVKTTTQFDFVKMLIGIK